MANWVSNSERRRERWDRTCPECQTTFSSVQECGICPKCSLSFMVNQDGVVLDVRGRPEDRIQPPRDIIVPENVEELIQELPSWVVDRVRRDFVEAEQPEVLRMLACIVEVAADRIWRTVLERAEGDAVYLRSLVLTAQEDWRNLFYGGQVSLPSQRHHEDEAPISDRRLLLSAIGHIFRWVAIMGVAAVLLWLCAQHDNGGMNGTCIPLPTMVVGVCLATGAAILCKRYWYTIASPFAAGIVGMFSIVGNHYGNNVGLLVGLLVALLPSGRRARPK